MQLRQPKWIKIPISFYRKTKSVVIIRFCSETFNHGMYYNMNNESPLSFYTQAGHVYIVDMKVMHGLKTKEGEYGCAPICLLYVNSAKKLVPIAIQLKQESGDDNPIFLPSDNWIDWLLAKMYFNSSFGQVIELVINAIMHVYILVHCEKRKVVLIQLVVISVASVYGYVYFL